jgi:hypothetical protein
MLITDLDGTLADKKGFIPAKNIEVLRRVGELGIKRVIATGRSIFSANKILDSDFPIDYLIFSSGAGILNWKTKEIILKNHIKDIYSHSIIKILIDYKIDFMIHKEIPYNHKFCYVRHSNNNSDFERRVKLYEDHSTPFTNKNISNITQIIAILPSANEIFNDIWALLNKNYSVKPVRATSPLDHKSVWLEIYPKHVSKAKAANWLLEKLNLNHTDTVAIGNDYNDIDLLDWSKKSYIVSTAPDELLTKYDVIDNSKSIGFYDMITKEYNQG